MEPIYLDYNATTPVDPAVAREMLPYIQQHFGNPSSSHRYGQRARWAVDTARHQVADLLGCGDDEIIFTSGGTEANNYAIKGVIGALKRRGNHIIEVCRFLEEQGARVTYLPVDEYGRVEPQQVEDAITAHTVLVTIMHANNEVGTLEPVREIADIAHRHGILVHADCAQSVGKIPVTVDQLGVDLLSMAGHKLYAPKGIGVLYRRQGVELEKLIHGANHEMNRRAGTENVIEIVGLGKACELVHQNLPTYQEHLRQMRDRLEQGLKDRFTDLRVNGHPQQRLPNTSSVSFPGVEASTLLARMEGVAASAGAACHRDQVEVSSVLEAMRVPLEYAMGTVRLSVGRYHTADEIDRAVAEIARAVRAHRANSPTTSTAGD
jgi:cysteine desulfurase NifS